MKERGIIFSGPMVRAILEGRKTQTRRIVTPHTSVLVDCRRKDWPLMAWNEAFVDPGPSPAGNPGPYLKVPIPLHETTHRVYPIYLPGDRLYVREKHRPEWDDVTEEYGIRFADDTFYHPEDLDEAQGWKMCQDADATDWERWSPSIHMPKAYARIRLEITSVRVERVQDITEEDAKAEGAEPVCGLDQKPDYRGGFYFLWDSINAKRGYGWDVNPWVWIVDFKVVKNGQ